MPIYKTNKKNADGKNQYKVRINYTDANGNYKTINRNIYGSTEAKELERKLVMELKSAPSGHTVTISSLFEEYHRAKKPEIRQTTYEKDESLFNQHIKPFLGSKTLLQLTPKVLTEWKLYLEDKNMALTSNRNIFAVLRKVLTYAVKMEYIEKNPIYKIDNFRDSYDFVEQDTHPIYTPEQFKEYKAIALKKAQETNCYDYYVFFCIAYYTGFRKGEIHALRWSRYDSKNLSVKKSITQKTKGEDKETPPKNKPSYRTIQVPVPLIEILDEHKERQKKYADICGIKWDDDFFICGFDRSLRDTTLDNENRRIAKAADLHHIRIHDFRHSHASLLINNNINVLEVSKRLGHGSIQHTLKTYAHLFPSENEKALAVLNNIV